MGARSWDEGPARRAAMTGARGIAPFLVWVAVATLVAAALPHERARTQSRSLFAHHRALDVPTPGGGPTQRVLVSWPRRSGGVLPTRERWPILIALHGAREAALPPSRGCLAWRVDYALDPALGALVRGTLTSQSYGGLVTPARLEAVNAALRARPFRGLFVVTPYTPPFRGVGSPEARAWGDWLAGPVLTAVRATFPASLSRDGVGIDGVSLGGRVALDVGLAHPEAFGAVGALQPAFDEAAMQALVDSAAARPSARAQRLRILTSDGDTGRAAAQALSAALRERRIEHELQVATGTHGYAFNRGPGALEMLLFPDAALAAEPLAAAGPR
jgi:hypothetical protein